MVSESGRGHGPVGPLGSAHGGDCPNCQVCLTNFGSARLSVLSTSSSLSKPVHGMFTLSAGFVRRGATWRCTGIRDPRSVVRGPWPVVCGPWSMVLGPLLPAGRLARALG